MPQFTLMCGQDKFTITHQIMQDTFNCHAIITQMCVCQELLTFNCHAIIIQMCVCQELLTCIIYYHKTQLQYLETVAKLSKWHSAHDVGILALSNKLVAITTATICNPTVSMMCQEMSASGQQCTTRPIQP